MDAQNNLSQAYFRTKVNSNSENIFNKQSRQLARIISKTNFHPSLKKAENSSKNRPFDVVFDLQILFDRIKL